jgi:hypothetical protein
MNIRPRETGLLYPGRRPIFRIAANKSRSNRRKQEGGPQHSWVYVIQAGAEGGDRLGDVGGPKALRDAQRRGLTNARSRMTFRSVE